MWNIGEQWEYSYLRYLATTSELGFCSFGLTGTFVNYCCIWVGWTQDNTQTEPVDHQPTHLSARVKLSTKSPSSPSVSVCPESEVQSGPESDGDFPTTIRLTRTSSHKCLYCGNVDTTLLCPSAVIVSSILFQQKGKLSEACDLLNQFSFCTTLPDISLWLKAKDTGIIIIMILTHRAFYI